MTTKMQPRWPKGTWMKLKSRDILKAIVADKAMSRRRLARYCGLAGSGMIDHLLDGRKTSCTPQLATRISEALGVPVEVLFMPKMPTVSGSRDNQRVA